MLRKAKVAGRHARAAGVPTVPSCNRRLHRPHEQGHSARRLLLEPAAVPQPEIEPTGYRRTKDFSVGGSRTLRRGSSEPPGGAEDRGGDAGREAEDLALAFPLAVERFQWRWEV